MAVKEQKEQQDKERSDRLKALEVTLSQIEKQFGKGSIMRLGQDTKLDIPALSTGSLALDLALGIGGVPRGRPNAALTRPPGSGYNSSIIP